jgi:nicotinate phosphoribosyltransferase
VDTYGVGTSVVTGSGAPTAGMVYKLVEVDGIPVAKRSSHKESRGGRKRAVRLARSTGTVVEELVTKAGAPLPATDPYTVRELSVPMVRGGEIVHTATVEDARTLVAEGLRSLPWEGLGLSQGDPAVPTVFS